MDKICFALYEQKNKKYQCREKDKGEIHGGYRDIYIEVNAVIITVLAPEVGMNVGMLPSQYVQVLRLHLVPVFSSLW